MESMQQKYDAIIGIDPDCDKSGVALVYWENHEPVLLTVASYSFPEVLDWLSAMNNTYLGKILVCIEGGWLNQGNWHLKRYHGMSLAKAAAMGRNVGMNHQTGILLSQLCGAMGVQYRIVKSLSKVWHGPDGKITTEELEYFTGWHGRCNQDARDAALLAWTYAGLPVKVKPIR